MADDIIDKINSMTESSSFTGERIDVAGRASSILGPLKKAVKQIGEKAGSTVEGVEKSISSPKEFPVIETIKGRKVQKPIVPTKEKPVEANVDDAKNDAAADAEIETSTQQFDEAPVILDETLEPPVNSVENAPPGVEMVPVQRTDVEQLMQQEPIITQEELATQLQKSKAELEALPKATEEELAGKTAEEIKQIRAQERQALLPPNQVFNLARAGDLAPALDAISKLADIDTATVSYVDIAEQIKKRGFDESFIEKLTGSNIDATPENSYKVLMAEEWSANQLDTLGSKVLDGTATQEDMLNAVKTISFHSLVMRSIKGYKTNLAQSFGILGMEMPNAAMFETTIDGLKSQEDLVSFFEKFKTMRDNPAAQVKMIDAIATGRQDRMLGAFVSGLTSAAGTLTRILAGDIPRVALRPVETLGASGVGVVRSMVGLGSTNRRYAQEALSQIFSIDAGIKNGFSAAAFAWKNKMSGIGADANRLEVKIRPDFFDIDPASNPLWKVTLGAYNFASSYGGRSVLTVSEFMKGIHYQMGLESLATRRGLEAQQLAFETTKDADAAYNAYVQASRDVFANPPDDVLKEAKFWTLESRPDKDTVMGQISGKIDDITSMKNPVGFVAKLKMPFIITPMNDLIQALERTPAKIFMEAADLTMQAVKGLDKVPEYLKDYQGTLNTIKNKVIEDINSGDYMKRDMALTKIGIGTGVITTAATMAAAGKLTGNGPKDKAERERWLAQGGLPFSYVIDLPGSENLSREQRLAIAEKDLGKAYKWSLGSGELEGKLFVSHSGMSTFSVLAGIGAMYFENYNDLDDQSALGAASATAMGIYDVVLDIPALQAIHDLDAFIPTVVDSEDKFNKVINDVAAWSSKTVGDVLIPASAARKYWVRNLDPTKYEYQVDPDMPVGLAGLVKGYEEMMHTIPYIGEDFGEEKRNIFNEIEEYSMPSAFTSKSIGKQDRAMQILTISGASSKKPNRKYSRTMPVNIDGETRNIPINLTLSPKEYKELLRIANDKKVRGGLELKQQILNLEANTYWKNGSADSRKSTVESIVENTYADAREKLYNGQNEIGESLRQRINEEAFNIRLKLQRPKPAI